MINDLLDQLNIISNAEYIPLPKWARFYVDLGYQIGSIQVPEGMYLRLIIVAPVTDYVATFISLGNQIAKTTLPIDVTAHRKLLKNLPEGNRVVRVYWNSWKKQRMIMCESQDADSIKYRVGHDINTLGLESPVITDIMPVYGEDSATGTQQYKLDAHRDLVSNPLLTSHYTHIINPHKPYSTIVGSIVRQKEELELECKLNTLQFKLGELIIDEKLVLLQPNIVLASSQLRSQFDDIDTELIVFTDANGIINYSQELSNRHHVYIFDYHDLNLGLALGQIQMQFFNRCEVDVTLRNNFDFNAAEVSAFFVWG